LCVIDSSRAISRFERPRDANVAISRSRAESASAPSTFCYAGVDVSVANGVVYAGCYHDDGELCALDAKNGNVLWSRGIVGGGYTTPIVLDGVLYGSCGGSSFCAFGLPENDRRR